MRRGRLSLPWQYVRGLRGYCVLLAALIGFWTFLVFSRSDVETTLLRAQGALFQQMPDGRFSNLYTVKVVNKTSQAMGLQLKLENVRGELQVLGHSIIVPPQELTETSVLIELDKANMLPGKTLVQVGVYSGSRRLQVLKTSFIGPRNESAKQN